MSEVESLYASAVASMKPCEKIARTIGIFNWTRDFIGREISRMNPSACPDRLKLLVALRMYGGDSDCRALIEGLLKNVPD